jgi:hypothetical protein
MQNINQHDSPCRKEEASMLLLEDVDRRPPQLNKTICGCRCGCVHSCNGGDEGGCGDGEGKWTGHTYLCITMDLY